MQKIKLNIVGREYAFRFEGSVDIITRAADELNEKVSQLQKETEGLYHEQAFLLVALSGIAQSLEKAGFSDSSKEFEKALHNEQEKVEKLTREIKALKNKPDYKKLSEKLSRLEKENKELLNEKKQLTTDVNSLLAEVKRLKQENNEILKSTNYLSQNEELNSEIIILKDKLEKANTEIDRLTDKLLQLQENNLSLITENKRLKEINEKSCLKTDDELLSQMVMLEKAAKDAEQKASDLQEQLDFSDKLNFKLANDIDLLELQLEELRHESNGQGEFYADMESKCKRLEIENEELKKKNDAYKIRLREIVEDGQLML